MSSRRWRSASSTSMSRSRATVRISLRRTSSRADPRITRRLTSRPARSASRTGFLPYTRDAGRGPAFTSTASGTLMDQRHGEDGNRLARADRSQAVVALGLEPHLAWWHPQGLGHLADHLLPVRTDPGHLEDDGEVDVLHGVAGFVEHHRHRAEELDAGGVLPLRVVAGEVVADVAHAGRAQEGIGQRVAHSVAVGVALEAEVPGQCDPSEDERAAYDQAVDVVALANAKPSRPVLAAHRQAHPASSARAWAAPS